MGRMPPISSSFSLVWACVYHIAHSLLATEKKSLFRASALTTGVPSYLPHPVSVAAFPSSLANVNQGPVGYKSVKGSGYVNRNPIQTVGDKWIHTL